MRLSVNWQKLPVSQTGTLQTGKQMIRELNDRSVKSLVAGKNGEKNFCLFQVPNKWNCLF